MHIRIKDRFWLFGAETLGEARWLKRLAQALPDGGPVQASFRLGSKGNRIELCVPGDEEGLAFVVWDAVLFSLLFHAALNSQICFLRADPHGARFAALPCKLCKRPTIEDDEFATRICAVCARRCKHLKIEGGYCCHCRRAVMAPVLV